MGILLCFCVKITFVWKNNKFFTYVNDYSMFTKWVETKHSFISIISIWNVRFRKSLKNRTRKIGVQMSSNPPKKSRKLVQNAFEQDKIIENNRKFIFCRKKHLHTFLFILFRALFSSEIVNWSLCIDPVMRLDLVSPPLTRGYTLKIGRRDVAVSFFGRACWTTSKQQRLI